MRFSVWPSNNLSFEDTLAVVREAERRKWHAAYYADHFMPNGEDEQSLRGNSYEALTILSALGASTATIRLGTLVASATYRHPTVAAKAFTSLDQLTGGRVIVGLGAGWQINEHASYGIDLGTISERIDRFEEYVACVEGMLGSEEFDFDGRYYHLTKATNDPRPVQSPPPILLGVRGEKRTMALAAKRAAIWNAWTNPQDLARLNGVLDRHCESIGRDPATIQRTTQAMVLISKDEAWLNERRQGAGARSMVVGTPPQVVEAMAAYRDAGCQEFILPMWGLDRAKALEVLALFDEEVVAELR
jgi:alkanesulfonate monooxygenase SsuD/methylene tetrahydromethanopterin reductase-like flavin-dependent oxidoreductase (luciferase family)